MHIPRIFEGSVAFCGTPRGFELNSTIGRRHRSFSGHRLSSESAGNGKSACRRDAGFDL
ncbi:hypothetical protein CRG98_005405 [Punica granatum]|uniref:Uncharacterized protein n=1 Tax=Punica granatum TaxID=22663 RepID=A0A2I0L0C7_PUNGR|nr:hypothetical protein CRG98_005405 [Punica granatum]